MTEKSKQLIDEICQLREQYLEEVGRGGRKPWPKSIKSRIIELCRSGIGAGELSELTGVPYHSVLPWRREAGLVRAKVGKKDPFHALTVTDQVTTRTVLDPGQSGTVTVQVAGVGEVYLPSVMAAADFVLRIKLGYAG